MFSLAALQSWFLAALFLGLFVQAGKHLTSLQYVFVPFAHLMYAAPMTPTKRQIGDLQCNIARGEIVADILAMQGTVSTLAKQVSSYVLPFNGDDVLGLSQPDTHCLDMTVDTDFPFPHQ